MTTNCPSRMLKISRPLVRVLSNLVPNAGIVLKVSLQGRVILHELPVIQKRWILADLLGNLWVIIEKAIELCNVLPIPGVQISGRNVAIFTAFRAIKLVFLSHECVRILSYFIANIRIALEIGLQFRMIPHIFRVVRERRVPAELVRDFAVSIEKPVETGDVPAVNVLGIAGLRIAVKPIFLMQEGFRILSQLSADIRIVLQELL